METLVKFCKPEYNILKGCHTIRFGTLEYYRDLDPSFAIADENEGKDSIHVKSLQSDTAPSESIEFLKGNGLVVKGNFHFQSCDILNEFPNCFVWCCSRVSQPVSLEQGKQFDAEYTSFYKIPNATRFAGRLGQLLKDSLKKTPISNSHFDDNAKDFIQGLSAYGWMDEIDFNVFHHNVIYCDQKKVIIDGEQLTSYANAEKIPSSLLRVFTKPKKYEENQEYRFIFLFQHKQYGVLGVQKEPVDLRIDPASRHLIDQTIVADHDKKAT